MKVNLPTDLNELNVFPHLDCLFTGSIGEETVNIDVEQIAQPIDIIG